jgi:hypothetical protein
VLGGLMWSAVGLMLCQRAYNWLVAVHLGWTISLGLLGILAALLAYRFGFAGIARKNVGRLCSFSEGACVFAFQSWQGYLMVIFMISLGLFLRHSAFPKHFLAVIYVTIGGALFVASFHITSSCGKLRFGSGLAWNSLQVARYGNRAYTVLIHIPGLLTE